MTCGGSVSSIGDSMGSGGVNTVVADPIGEYSAVVVVAALILCVMVGGRLAIAASGVWGIFIGTDFKASWESMLQWRCRYGGSLLLGCENV